MIEENFVGSEFVDRLKTDHENAVDVIIPLIHSNQFWTKNLNSIYREIPVKRLLISDGGCIDDSLVLLKDFPRVEIFDHTSYTSLGYCLRSLIEKVETEHFVYLHSDVLLTPGWFDQMYKHRSEYDWSESSQVTSFFVNIPVDYTNYHRPLSGGQLGRRAAFDRVLPKIDDDFLYRNEDLIFAELIKDTGGKYGRVEEALLYHQVMNKRSRWERKISQFSISVTKSPEEEIREANMQARGLVKYVPPSNIQFKHGVIYSLRTLIDLDQTTYKEFIAWVATTPYGPEWQKVLNRAFSYHIRVAREVRGLLHTIIWVWRTTLGQTMKFAKAVCGR